APEYEENRWLIEECIRRGITVSAAHTDATYEQVMAAVDLGLSHATHTYNAMSGLHHRKPGTLGAVMASPQVRCEIIADNIHVHPGAMKLAFAAKGAGGIVLVTDAIRGAGMPDGTYPVDDREITVKDGSARLADGTLAGSILTMNAALRNFMNATGAPLETIWPVTSLNPAQAVGIASRKGSLEIGKDADLVLVDDSISVHLTMVEGRIVYQSTW
ncbi:MAG: N-acetylglucosamine-6-phosphate deacetylase, partial [Phototrophicaceae bacterium]